jgi:beta-lactamase regulating signal transducer with metallopeptidase domain
MFDANARFWLPLFTDAAAKSAFVLVITLSLWAVMRRAPAASRHLMLLTGIAVLLGLPLLMPLVPRQSLPSVFFQSVFSEQLSAPAPPSASTPFTLLPSVLSSSVLSSSILSPKSAPPTMSLPSPASITIAPRQALSPFDWRAWLLLGWLVGVLIAAVRILAAHRRVWRLIRRCPPLPMAFRELLGPEPGRGAVLRLGPAGTPPLVWGGLRPVLLLPADALAWPRERIRAVLLHETAHLERRDWLTQTLTQIVCALYWFNPLVWLTAFQMQAEAERACDDAVILAGVPATDYAQNLLAVARSLTAARHASAGAVTMARRSPVRGRLEAILDAARPRRRVTRRAAALSLLAALAVAVPLAALHPAVRADQRSASPTEPSADVPTEADIAAVRQHLKSLEQEQAGYAAAHPNTLTSAQIAEVDQWLFATKFKQNRENFVADEATDNLRLRAEAKKPHTPQEKREIWGQIYAYEHPPQIVLQRHRDFDRQLAQQSAKVAGFPVMQRERVARLRDLDQAIAVDNTQIEAMQMERAEGYSLHFDKDQIVQDARSGLQWEKQGAMSRADWVHVDFLEQKLHQEKHVDDTDIDSLAAILKEPLTTVSVSPATVMAFFRNMQGAGLRPVPETQQQKIRAAVTPFLTSHSKWPIQDKWDHISAKQVLTLYGDSKPPLSQKHPLAPAPAASHIPQPSHPKGVSPMTPPKSMKTALLTAAAFTFLDTECCQRLASGQTDSSPEIYALGAAHSGCRHTSLAENLPATYDCGNQPSPQALARERRSSRRSEARGFPHERQCSSGSSYIGRVEQDTGNHQSDRYRSPPSGSQTRADKCPKDEFQRLRRQFCSCPRQ